MKRIIILTLFTVFLLSSLLLASCEINDVLHNHDFGEWETVKEATCTENGSRARNCSCGESETEVISATGHTEEVLAEKPATCTESGLAEGKKCTVCGEITVNQEEILALNHDYKYTEETDENGNIVIVAVCQREDCGEVKENPAGLYDAENNLLASWTDLLKVYGLNVDSGDISNIGSIIKQNEFLQNGTKLLIDDLITKINLAMFEGCPNITSILIPSSITSIINTSWSGCVYLKNIIVDENNEYYKSIDGNLFDKEGKTLIQYASGKEDKEFTIPDGVEKIERCAMMYSPFLEKLYIPDSVTFIGSNGFGICDSLANVYFAGTTEEWEAIEDRYSTGYWLNNKTRIHYDGKIQFYESNFWQGGNGSIPRSKYVVDGKKIYINDILYEQVIGASKPEFENENKERIFYYLKDSDEKSNIVMQIFDNEDWYILQTDAVTGVQQIAICQIENTWYFLYILLNNHIYRIGYATINWEL